MNDFALKAALGQSHSGLHANLQIVHGQPTVDQRMILPNLMIVYDKLPLVQVPTYSNELLNLYTFQDL